MKLSIRNHVIVAMSIALAFLSAAAAAQPIGSAFSQQPPATDHGASGHSQMPATMQQHQRMVQAVG